MVAARRFALLALVAIGCGRSQGAVVFPGGERPIVFAHRGGSGEAPESTLPALLGAARDPDTWIELDVRASRDGQLVVIHDATVDRTTDGSGRVAALTLAQLKALDAGFCATPGQGTGTARRGQCSRAPDPGRFPFRGQGIRIPTLPEVLAQLPPDRFLGIEVKAPGFEAPLAALLRASGRLSRLVIGLADSAVAARIAQLLPDVPRFFPSGAGIRLVLASKLTWGWLSWPAHQVLVAPPSTWAMRLDTRGMIDTYHRQGVMVSYFTINDEAEMERLFRLGADGLFTDYPTRARRVLDRLRAAGALR